jgi:hypothetical protein
MPEDILPLLPCLPDAQIRHIPNFPGYAITNTGEVWGCLLPGNSKRFHSSWRKRQPRTHKDGHRYIPLYKDGKEHRIAVSRLVLTTFVGPCPLTMEACHENGVAMDDSLGNLRWDTRPANHADKRKHGTLYKGEKHWIAKLTKADIPRIRAMYTTGNYMQKDLARIFHVSPSNIGYIVARKTWKSIFP